MMLNEIPLDYTAKSRHIIRLVAMSGNINGQPVENLTSKIRRNASSSFESN